MRVVVVGAGVVGMSVATQLAIRGAEVTVVEQWSPGAGTSAETYGWVNSNNKEPQPYFELNLAGLEAHRRLAHDEHGHWLEVQGHVELATEPAHMKELSERVSRLESHDYGAAMISRSEARRLIPDLIVPDGDSVIAYFSREAHCYPQMYLAHLLTRAAATGVKVRSGVAVTRLQHDGGVVTVTLANGIDLVCDQVVSCVGRWTTELLAEIADVPMATFETPGDASVGYLAVTNPQPVMLTRLLTTSSLNVRPDGGGRLRLQALDLDASADPCAVPTTTSAVATELLDRLAAVLNNSGYASLDHLGVGQRALPADGLTVAGALQSAPWVYVVATHSGVTLAPLLGELVADEVTGSSSRAVLSAFRPDRLTGGAANGTPQLARRPGQQ